MGSLTGKVVIVTGASRGIGAAASIALAKAGATVMLVARNGRLAADVAQGIIELLVDAPALRPATCRIMPPSRPWCPKPKAASAGSMR